MRILLPAFLLGVSMTTAATADAWHAANRQPLNAASYIPPKHWTKSRADWRKHVERCYRRYRRYDPRTDRYYFANGRTKICTI